MSSMFLLKDYDHSKKGEVVSVPFVQGKSMIAAGIARYWNDGEGEGKNAQKSAEGAPSARNPGQQSKDAKAPAGDSWAETHQPLQSKTEAPMEDKVGHPEKKK